MQAHQRSYNYTIKTIATQVLQRKRRLVSLDTMKLMWSACRRQVQTITLRKAGLLGLIAISASVCLTMHLNEKNKIPFSDGKRQSSAEIQKESVSSDEKSTRSLSRWQIMSPYALASSI